ncbi:MAG: hypothetical protein BGP22_24530 [Variovorax sp. 67-131]|nr:MAG: hypothetical protein ABS94_12805 [Variovorax sp. SCN 67-85]ODV23737.1 MAG: hypothetical protein ABT25_17675 [Variovorax sp. SCN 67-20]OJZ13025.1 MAG: hypothetical protein BGP22_24530 [Variovorax sp. 67-131]
MTLLQLFQIRGDRRFDVASFRELDLCWRDLQIFLKDASNIVCTIQSQVIGSLLAGLGGSTDIEGLMVRIPVAKIDHPVRQPGNL